MPQLATAAFWQDLAERLGRQAAQTAVPIILASGLSTGLHASAVLTAVGVALVVTFLKTIAGVTASPDEPLAWQLIDRALPAAAGTILGFVPVDLASLANVDWVHVSVAALSAAVLAVVAYYVTPPVQPLAYGQLLLSE